jgi:hypothetical protein
MKLIETKTLGTAAASIEFTSIPQDATDLLLTISARSASNFARNDITITINNDTGSNYSYRRIIGYDSGQVAGDGSSGTPTQTRAVSITGNGATANTFSNSAIYFPDYTSTTSKSFSIETTAENNSSTDYIMGIFYYRYTTTAGITSIKMEPDSFNFLANSTFSLYSITKGSDGIVTTS